MSKRLLPLVLVCLVAATATLAQPGGGRPRGGGGRASAGPAKPAKPYAAPDLIGVVKAIDADTGRVTIAYEASDALGWPASTQPFPVAKTALLKDVTVGEKVRFQLESQQISAIKPF